MAQKIGDKWREQLYFRGVRESATFRTRREAESWKARRRIELEDAAKASPGERYTLGEVFQRYADEVSPTKRGVRWEQIRLAKFMRDERLPVRERIGRVTPEMIAAWRTWRLTQVGPGTVIRELGLISSVFEHARREWRLVPANPVSDVRRPRSPDHREVLIHWRQIRAILKECGYTSKGRITQVKQAVAMAFLLALRTGMRAGEIAGLTWDRVLEDHVALPVTKTKPRKVPLTPQALRVVRRMEGWDSPLVFGLKATSLDANFRKYRDRAGLEGFTFHDARHTAATMLVKSKKIDVLTLCKIFGWSNPKQAAIYYNPTTSQLLDMLSNGKINRR